MSRSVHVEISHPDMNYYQLTPKLEPTTYIILESQDIAENVTCFTTEQIPDVPEEESKPVLDISEEQIKRRRSVAWKLFADTGLGSKLKCKVCGINISCPRGRSTNLIRHMKQKHSTVDLNSKNVEEMFTYYKVKDTAEENKKLIHVQLLTMLVKGYQSLSLVDDQEFKTFVKLLNPSFSLPCKKTLSMLYPELYSIIVEKVKSELLHANAVSVTLDGWISVRNESFIAVTAHFLNESTELKSYLLDCFMCSDSYFADSLATNLTKVLTDWNIIEKVAVMVSENTADMEAAAQRCQLQHIPCFAHTVNLVVQAGIQEISSIHGKVKSAIQFFHSSQQASQNLMDFQKQNGLKELKLKQDVPTRWKSTYDMFQRFIEMKEPIMATLALWNPDLVLQETDWVILQKVCDLLSIFLEVTMEMNCEKSVTLSKVLLICKGLMKQVLKISTERDVPEEIRRMTTVVSQGLETQFAGVELNSLLIESAILDPRFKHQGLHDEVNYKNACQNLQQMVAAIHTNSQLSASDNNISVVTDQLKSSVWEEFYDEVKNVLEIKISADYNILEMDRYLQEPFISRKEDPLAWWKERKSTLPSLYEIMRSRLSIPATCVPREQIVSPIWDILVY